MDGENDEHLFDNGSNNQKMKVEQDGL